MANKTIINRLAMLEAACHTRQTILVYDDYAEVARLQARHPSALIIHVTYEDGPMPEAAEAFRDALTRGSA